MVSKKVLLTQSLSKLTKSVLLLKHSTLSKWLKKLVTLPLYHTVQVKLKIQQSLTSQLQQTQDKSRLVHLSRTDRIAKYNQLLRIEDQLGEVAEYRGIEIILQP